MPFSGNIGFEITTELIFRQEVTELQARIKHSPRLLDQVHINIVTTEQL